MFVYFFPQLSLKENISSFYIMFKHLFGDVGLIPDYINYARIYISYQYGAPTLLDCIISDQALAIRRLYWHKQVYQDERKCPQYIPNNLRQERVCRCVRFSFNNLLLNELTK